MAKGPRRTAAVSEVDIVGGSTPSSATAAPSKKRKSGVLDGHQSSGSHTRHTRATQPKPAWSDFFVKLVLFQSKNRGSSIIPNDDAEHRELAEWARGERALYNKCAKGEVALDPEQEDHVAALKQVGFVFEANALRGPAVSAANESHWQEKYDEVVQYRQGNNGEDPKTTTKLGQWLNNQRQAFREYAFLRERLQEKYPHHRPLLPEEMPRRPKGSKNKEAGIGIFISQERIDKLNALEGFSWGESAGTKWTPWEQRLEEYKQFQMEHGHGFVPQHFKNNRALGKWVNKMRTEYLHLQRGDKSQISQERLRQLEAANFEFSSRRGKKAGHDLSETEGLPS